MSDEAISEQELINYLSRLWQIQVQMSKKSMQDYIEYLQNAENLNKQIEQMANPKPGVKVPTKSTDHKVEEAAGLKPTKVKSSKKKK